jgi:hypothetical protein
MKTTNKLAWALGRIEVATELLADRGKNIDGIEPLCRIISNELVELFSILDDEEEE